MHVIQLIQKESEQGAYNTFNFKTGKQETLQLDSPSSHFVPFLKERNQIGKISRCKEWCSPLHNLQSQKNAYAEIGQIKKRLQLALDDDSAIPSNSLPSTKKHKRFVILKELSQGGIQGQPTSRWERVSLKPPQWNRRFSDMHDLQKNVQGIIDKDIEILKSSSCFIAKFVKKDKYIEKYKNSKLMNSVQRSVPTTPQISPLAGRESRIIKKVSQQDGQLSPPVGYYNIKEPNEFKKTPMLVNMAKSSNHWRSSSLKYTLTESQTEKQFYVARNAEESQAQTNQQHINQMYEESRIQQVSEANLKRKLEIEYDLLKERQKFSRQEYAFDKEYLQNFTKNVDGMKKRIRMLKVELASWADKQVSGWKPI